MKKIGYIFVVSLIIKLILSATFPLSLDEAYYWVWSKHLSLSYFDHPPFIAWLFWSGNWLESFFHAVRWPIVVSGHLTLWVWILILKEFLSEKQLEYFIWMALISPLIGLGSIIGTPDVPLLLFWTLSLFFLIRILKSHQKQDYAFLGITLGLGFCAKYHIVIFVISLLLYLILEKKYSEIRWRYVWYTALCGMLFSLPVLIWNYQNDFISFRFQISHGLGSSPSFSINQLKWPVEYILGQLILIFPVVIWFASKARPQGLARLFIYFGVTPVLFFFLTSFRAATEANWPLMAIPSLIALAIMSPINRRAIYVHQFFWILIYAILFSSIFYVPLHDKIYEPIKYKAYSYVVKKYTPLYTSDYQSASSLWYFTKIPVYKLKGTSRFDFFDFLSESQPNTRKFYFLKEFDDEFPEWLSHLKFTTELMEENTLFKVFLVKLE